MHKNRVSSPLGTLLYSTPCCHMLMTLAAPACSHLFPTIWTLWLIITYITWTPATILASQSRLTWPRPTRTCIVSLCSMLVKLTPSETCWYKLRVDRLTNYGTSYLEWTRSETSPQWKLNPALKYGSGQSKLSDDTQSKRLELQYLSVIGMPPQSKHYRILYTIRCQVSSMTGQLDPDLLEHQ